MADSNTSITPSTGNARISHYLDGRWKEQKEYFSVQSKKNKKMYQRIQVFVGIASILVPVTINIPGVSSLVPTIISAAAAIGLLLENVNHYGQRWHNCRLASEALKSQYAIFETKANQEQYFDDFVNNCENIINIDIKGFDKLFEGKPPTNSGAGSPSPAV